MEEARALPWEIVARAAGMAEANLIAGRLASEGLRTRLDYEAAGTIYAITVDGLGEVRILVPAPEGEWAREILARAYDDSELAWETASPIGATDPLPVPDPTAPKGDKLS